MSTFLLNPVLVVESSLETRQSLCSYIQSSAALTIEASNGQEALDLWCLHKSSIIFLDFELTDMHGLAVIEYIKSKDPDTYIIAATALNDADVFKKSIALGVDGWLTKPFSAEQINPTMLKARQTCAYRRSERLMKASFRESASGNLILNADGNVEHANEIFLTMMGLTEQEVLGCNPSLFIKYSGSSVLDNSSREAIISSQTGTITAVLVFTGPADELTLCRSVSIVDITNLKNRELEIRRLATTDALTGLPNRTVIEDRIHQAILRSNREKHTLAVMFIDLDKFKMINDTYGHEIGDLLLIEFSKRITSLLRESDTLSRFGGDEFIVLLPEVSNVAGAIYTAHKILDISKETFKISGHALNISCSIGISIYPDLVSESDILLRKSDEAMYVAKNNGRGQIFVINQH